MSWVCSQIPWGKRGWRTPSLPTPVRRVPTPTGSTFQVFVSSVLHGFPDLYPNLRSPTFFSNPPVGSRQVRNREETQYPSVPLISSPLPYRGLNTETFSGDQRLSLPDPRPDSPSRRVLSPLGTGVRSPFVARTPLRRGPLLDESPTKKEHDGVGPSTSFDHSSHPPGCWYDLSSSSLCPPVSLHLPSLRLLGVGTGGPVNLARRRSHLTPE